MTRKASRTGTRTRDTPRGLCPGRGAHPRPLIPRPPIHTGGNSGQMTKYYTTTGTRYPGSPGDLTHQPGCAQKFHKISQNRGRTLCLPPLGPLFASTRQHNSTQQSARNTKSINIVRHSLRAPKYGTENQDFKSTKILAICYPTRCPDHSEENQTTGHPTSSSVPCTHC